jgi:hypothetical protein
MVTTETLGYFGLMMVIHIAAFLAPAFLGKKKTDDKITLNLQTYMAITRLKTQVNNVAIVMGYTLALAKAGGDVSFFSVVTTLIPVLISFATFFYGGSIYVINALSDIEDDKKEKPHRPLPSGLMSVQHTTAFALINLVLSFASAALLGGMRLVTIYGAFLVINLVYSFVLRPGMSITVPLIFISVTLPLRLYMGTAIADSDLPWPIFLLTYQIYIGMQFMRKVILQNKIDVSNIRFILISPPPHPHTILSPPALQIVAVAVHWRGLLLGVQPRPTGWGRAHLPRHIHSCLSQLCLHRLRPIAPIIHHRAAAGITVFAVH